MASTPAAADSMPWPQGPIIDGRALAAASCEALLPRIEHVRSQRSRPPGLGVILVGDDAPSALYVRNKARAAAKLQMHSLVVHLDQSVSERKLLASIDAMNADDTIDAFLVQLPLPPHLNPNKVLARIAPHKDADALAGHALLDGSTPMMPCTASGCLAIIEAICPTIAGLHAVVVGRSAIVGRPTAKLLLRGNATVTVCHSHTTHLAQHTRMADVLVVAAGRPHLIGASHVKPGAVVIDVGIHRIVAADGRAALTGDVDTRAVLGTVKAITPVPGGVGPMTIAMLMANAVAAAENTLHTKGLQIMPSETKS